MGQQNTVVEKQEQMLKQGDIINDLDALKISLIEIFQKQEEHFKNLDYQNEIKQLEKYEIFFVDNFFPSQLCKDLIEKTSKLGYHQALVNIGNGKGIYDKTVRDCERVMIDDIQSKDFLNKYVEKIVPLCSEGAFFEGMNERFRFLKYNKDGIFSQHCDGRIRFSDSIETHYTIHFYLNDVKSGGSTIFYHKTFPPEGKKCEAKQGRVAVFRQQGWLHEGEKVLKGLKYTFRTDVSYKWITNEEANQKQVINKKCYLCGKNPTKIQLENCNHPWFVCGCPIYNKFSNYLDKKTYCKICQEPIDLKKLNLYQYQKN